MSAPSTSSSSVIITIIMFHICTYKAVYEVPACLDTCKELIHFRALAPESNVNGRSIQSFKKGRSSRALQFTNKLTSEELKVTRTRPLLANQWCIICENKCTLLDVVRRIPRGYEILRSWILQDQFTTFSQNNAVENYRKYQKKHGSTIIVAWFFIIMGWSW